MENKRLTLLGFAAKAGRLAYGFEAARVSLKGKKARCIVAASDVSRKSLKEITFFADENRIPVVSLSVIDMQTLSDAVGRRCGILSVNDEGFAQAILKEEKLDDQ